VPIHRFHPQITKVWVLKSKLMWAMMKNTLTKLHTIISTAQSCCLLGVPTADTSLTHSQNCTQ
jgi:hypothetical protein